LIRERIYAGHPYSKNILGTQETVKKIQRSDLVDFYKKYITPHGSTLAIVGQLKDHDVRSIVERVLGAWQGPEVEETSFPALSVQQSEVIDYPINRDQVVLCFAGLSIDRNNEDYDKLILFDQIFGGGVLGSMSSRLFQLREQSGLFYTINGSLTAHSDKQPGMVLVKTIVSVDRLKEAEQVIKATIDTAADTIHPNEFAEAKSAIVNSLANYFEANSSVANAFLFLEKYNLPNDYFDTRAAALDKIKVEDMQQAVKKVLRNDTLFTLRVGRIGETVSS